MATSCPLCISDYIDARLGLARNPVLLPGKQAVKLTLMYRSSYASSAIPLLSAEPSSTKPARLAMSGVTAKLKACKTVGFQRDISYTSLPLHCHANRSRSLRIHQDSSKNQQRSTEHPIEGHAPLSAEPILLTGILLSRSIMGR
jgi:hypothetical protein